MVQSFDDVLQQSIAVTIRHVTRERPEQFCFESQLKSLDHGHFNVWIFRGIKFYSIVLQIFFEWKSTEFASIVCYNGGRTTRGPGEDGLEAFQYGGRRFALQALHPGVHGEHIDDTQHPRQVVIFRFYALEIREVHGPLLIYCGNKHPIPLLLLTAGEMQRVGVLPLHKGMHLCDWLAGGASQPVCRAKAGGVRGVIIYALKDARPAI